MIDDSHSQISVATCVLRAHSGAMSLQKLLILKVGIVVL